MKKAQKKQPQKHKPTSARTHSFAPAEPDEPKSMTVAEQEQPAPGGTKSQPSQNLLVRTFPLIPVPPIETKFVTCYVLGRTNTL